MDVIEWAKWDWIGSGGLGWHRMKHDRMTENGCDGWDRKGWVVNVGQGSAKWGRVGGVGRDGVG